MILAGGHQWNIHFQRRSAGIPVRSTIALETLPDYPSNHLRELGRCRIQECPRRGRTNLIGLFIVMLLLGFGGAAWSQEAIRMSLASADAAAARRRAVSTFGYYNLRLGPTAWRFGAGLGLEYNDNVQLQQENPLNDFIFRPHIEAQMLWPVTEKNAINLSLGCGYAAYAHHSDLNRLYVTPGSELSFDLYLGDLWVNVHDRFSIIEDSYQDPTVAGTGNYSRLQNALGLAATWDLNKVLVRAGYDHVDYLAFSGNNQQPDGQSELVSTSIGYNLKPGLLAGAELGGGLLHYSGPSAFFRDAKQWNAGMFLEAELSQYLRLRGSVGYTDYAPDNRQFTSFFIMGTNVVVATNSITDFTGIYGQVDLQHQLNRFVAYTLSAGRTINFGFYANSVDLIFIRLLTNWRIVRKVTIGTSFDFETGSEGIFFNTRNGAGRLPETFNRYGGRLTVGRGITAKASASLSYQFFWRNSNLPGRSYTDNIVSLNFNYRF